MDFQLSQDTVPFGEQIEYRTIGADVGWHVRNGRAIRLPSSSRRPGRGPPTVSVGEFCAHARDSCACEKARITLGSRQSKGIV